MAARGLALAHLRHEVLALALLLDALGGLGKSLTAASRAKATSAFSVPSPLPSLLYIAGTCPLRMVVLAASYSAGSIIG